MLGVGLRMTLGEEGDEEFSATAAGDVGLWPNDDVDGPRS